MPVQVLLSVGDGATPGHLDLTAGDYNVLDGTFDHTQPGRLRFTVSVSGVSMPTVARALGAIQRKLDQARAGARGEGPWVTLGVQFNTIGMVYYDVVRGSLSVQTSSHAGIPFEAHWIDVDIELETLPNPRGEIVAGTGASGLTGESAAWLEADVQGDVEALVRLEIEDTSSSGAINRVRYSRRGRDGIALADFEPWIDLADIGAGTVEADVTAFGDSYLRLVTSSTTLQAVGRAAQPALSIAAKGRYDVWCRCRATSAALSAPSGFNGTVVAPTPAVPEVPEVPSEPDTVTRRQLVTNNNGAGASSVSITPSLTTLAGNLLAAAVTTRNVIVSSGIVKRQQSPANDVVGVSSIALTLPAASLAGSLLVAFVSVSTGVNILQESGWTNIALPEHGTGFEMAVFYRENSAALTSVTFDFNAAGDASGVIFEYTGIATSGSLIGIGTQGIRTDEDTTSFEIPGTASAPGEMLLIGGSTQHRTAGSGVASHAGWTNGFTEIYDRAYASDNSYALGVAHQIVDAPGYYFTSVNADAADTTDWVTVGFGFKSAPVVAPPEVAITPPSGWADGATAINYDDPARPVKTSIFFRENAPATSGAQSFTMVPNGSAEIAFAEYTGIRTSEALDISGGVTSEDSTTTTIRTDGVSAQADALVFAVFGAFAAPSYTIVGLTEIADSGGMAVAQAIATTRQQFSATATASSASAFANAVAVFRVNMSAVVDAVDAIPEGEHPGDLVAGTYTARAQAVDSAGAAGNATASTSDVVATEGSAIDYGLTAPAGSVSHYLLTVQLGTRFYEFAVLDGTSYRLESLSAGREVSGLPATSGAVGPDVRIRPRIGTSGDASDDLSLLPGVNVSSGATFVNLRLATGRDLPPVGENQNGEQPEWAIELDTASPNGLSTTIDMDALWIAPHDESQAVVEFAPLDLATPRRWVLESHRSGQGVIAWLEVIATGAETGRLAPGGSLLLAPDDDVVSLLLEQAAGASVLTAASCNVTLSYWPRFRWQKWQ